MAIFVAALGTPEQPVELQGGITLVNRLHMAGRLYVRIPSGVTWNSVSFKCDELDLRHVFAWLTTLDSPLGLPLQQQQPHVEKSPHLVS